MKILNDQQDSMSTRNVVMSSYGGESPKKHYRNLPSTFSKQANL